MRPRLGLAGAVLLGAALRLYPIWFGLPYAQARPDETASLGRAVAILAGDTNPHFFHWPSLTLYLFAGLITVAGAVTAPLDFSGYALIARTSVALAGTVTILVLARLTWRVTADAGTATVAALLLAIAPLHVRESHFAMTDVLMTLFATAALGLLVEAAETPSLKTLALAGLAGGLATSTKYSAAPLLLSVFVADLRTRAIAVYITAFAFAFTAGTPYSLLDFQTFRTDFIFISQHLASEHVAGSLGRGWTSHLVRSLPYGMGIPAFIAAVAGGLLVLTRHRRRAMPIVVFALAFLLAIGSGRTVFFRYILPLIPLACLAAAVALRSIAGPWGRFLPVRYASVTLTSVIVALVAGVPLANSVRMDVLLGRTDSRVLASEWLVPQLRPEQTLHDAGGDYTRLDLGRAQFHDWPYDPSARSFGAPAGALPDWIVLYDSPLTEYAKVPESLRDLVAQRYRLVHEVRAMRADEGAVFDRQDAFFLPIAGFSGVERPGPNVAIYFRR